MDNIQEVFILFLMGMGAILALIFTLSASVFMVGLSAKSWRAFVTIDRQLAPFGNTITGRYIHDQLTGLRPYVDNADDKTIQAALKLPILNELYKKGIIDAKGLSKGVSEALGLAIDLFDGVPTNETLKPLPNAFRAPWVEEGTINIGDSVDTTPKG